MHPRQHKGLAQAVLHTCRLLKQANSHRGLPNHICDSTKLGTLASTASCTFPPQPHTLCTAPLHRDSQGRSALYNLLASTHLEQAAPLVKLLIDHGADPMDCGPSGAGDNLLHVLSRPEIGTTAALDSLHHLLNALRGHQINGGLLAAVMLQHANAAGLPPAHKCIELGNIDAMCAYVRLGGYLSMALPSVSGTGNTALHAAVASGDTEVVKAMLKTAAAVAAAAGGEPGAVQWAMERMCGISSPNSMGLTPLLVATAAGDAAMMEVLLQQSPAGAHLPGSDGRSALHLAAEAGSVEAVEVRGCLRCLRCAACASLDAVMACAALCRVHCNASSAWTSYAGALAAVQASSRPTHLVALSTCCAPLLACLVNLTATPPKPDLTHLCAPPPAGAHQVPGPHRSARQGGHHAAAAGDEAAQHASAAGLVRCPWRS